MNHFLYTPLALLIIVKTLFQTWYSRYLCA